MIHEAHRKRFEEIKAHHQRMMLMPGYDKIPIYQAEEFLVSFIELMMEDLEKFETGQSELTISQLQKVASTCEDGIGEILGYFRQNTGLKGFPDVIYRVDGGVQVALKVYP